MRGPERQSWAGYVRLLCKAMGKTMSWNRGGKTSWPPRAPAQQNGTSDPLPKPRKCKILFYTKIPVEVTPPLINLLGDSVVELVKVLLDCGFKTMYSVELNSKVAITKLSDKQVISTFGDVSRNYILEKGSKK